MLTKSVIFELCGDLDTFKLNLYSFSRHPEDGPVSGRIKLVTKIQ